MASDLGTTHDDARTGARPSQNLRSTAVRRSTETKHSSKTSELYVWAAVTISIVVAGLLTKAGDGADDRLASHQVWLYVAIVSAAYMVSRGLAKAGSRDPYTDHDRH
jgi:hypothetical protein